MTPRGPCIRRQALWHAACYQDSKKWAGGSHLITAFFIQRLPTRQEEADIYEEFDLLGPSNKRQRIGGG